MNEEIRRLIMLTAMPPLAVNRILQLEKMVDALVNHCGKEGGECSVCSAIICPFGCDMHLHHDGCPMCTSEDDELETEEETKVNPEKK